MSPDGQRLRVLDNARMSEWDVRSFESFGPLAFGATTAEVRVSVAATPRPFRKGASSNVVEAYGDAGVHAFYDSAGRLEFVEAFVPCLPTYAGNALLGRALESVLEDLETFGVQPRDDGQGGLWFDELGFALYAPSGELEGVSVFRRGYDTGASP
jgi:hypothetical protein